MAKKTEKKELNNKTNNEQQQKPNLAFVEQKIPSIYINHAQFLASNYDAALLIGEIVGVDEDNTLQVAPRAKLVMSHTFTKELLRLLARNIDAMEQQVAKDEEANKNDADSSEAVH